jgi:HK97 family phage major capsid protein
MDTTLEEIRAELARIMSDVKTPLSELQTKQGELQARLMHVEQKQLVRPVNTSGGISVGGYGAAGLAAMLAGGGADNSPLTDFVKNDEGFAMLRSGKIKATTLTLPAGAFHTKAALLTGPGIGGVDRLAGIVGPPPQRVTIRSLLNVVNTTAPSIEYVAEGSFASGAATVAEGSLKPETTLDLTLETATVCTIATWVACSKQILADVGQLQNYLDGRLRLAIALAEEAQILNGSGVGSNLLGLVTAGTAYVSPFVYATPTKLDVLRLACAQLQESDFTPTGIVLHPNDAAAIALLKSTEGVYLAPPSSLTNSSFWGVPVVVSRSMTAGSFLVADFKLAATLFDREAVTLDVGFANDDFLKNMIRLRAEERVSLAVTMPAAVVKGVFA